MIALCTALHCFIYLPDASAASEIPRKSSFSNLTFSIEVESPIIRMIKLGIDIPQTPNNTKQSLSNFVLISHRKY